MNITRIPLFAVVLFFPALAFCCAHSCESNQKSPSVQQDSSPAAPADSDSTSPTPAGCAISPKFDNLLNQIEIAGTKLKTFQADMLFQQAQTLIDTLELRHGRLYYQADKNAVRFRIHFDDFQQIELDDEDEPAPVVSLDLDYIFDGTWFTKRDARNKNIQRRQIAETPQGRESFRLGRGPFPLPFAIRKADILKEFHLALVKTDPNDPAETRHLRLTPRKDGSYAEQYIRLDLWLSSTTTVPEQLRYETDDGEITTVTWSAIKLDAKLPGHTFKLPAPGPGWSVETIPLEKPQQGPSP